MFIQERDLLNDPSKCSGVPRQSSVGFEMDMVVDSVGGGGGTNTEWEGRVVGDGEVGV